MSEIPQPPPPDPELVAAGWERRFMADPERAAEAVELYEGMGLEVKVFPLAPLDFGLACGECPGTIDDSYVVIYTRKPGATRPGAMEV